MSLIAVLLGALGAVLCVFRSRWCFLVWLFPNAFWIWFNGDDMQRWVYVIMTVSCVVGWIKWDRDAIKRRQMAEEHAVFFETCTVARDTIITLQAKIKELEDRAAKCCLCNP
ncbi:hypothetical protein LCGC14_1927620 [marine sediment metagenome]|uniref:Uncharacterized protein n=1 Tax=marine sediment metagenome TaxID=412755 RepID=A0A0F9I2S7_9ZZZZ